MTQAEHKWAHDEMERLHKERIEQDRLKEKGLPCINERERKELDARFSKYQGKTGDWSMGEEHRKRHIWYAQAEAWATERIQRRGETVERTGFDLKKFVVQPDKQDKKLTAYLVNKKPKGTMKRSIEDESASQQNAKLWLPVCYEYARQSPRWLAWARLTWTAKASGVPFADSDAHSHGRDTLARTLGQGWIDALGCLAEFMGQDIPFSEIPMSKRQSIARTAANASRSQVNIHPDTFGIRDAGRPTFAPFMKWAGRRFLRIANLQESVGTRHFNSFDARTREITTHEVRDALNATVDESFVKPHKGPWIPSKSKIEYRTNDDLSARRVSNDGEESIVLRVNWNMTSNQEIGDAMAHLCERIRPTRWPEFKEEAGDHDQGADKALRVLLYWRMTASINAGSKSLDDEKLKTDLRAKRRALGNRALRDKAEAKDWFERITGDSVAPWWSVTNRK